MTLTRTLPLLSLAALLALAPRACAAGMDFPETAGLTWSTAKTATSPENNLTIHGEFSNELVTASLDKLPPHDYVEITVKLLILHSWDGVARSNGGARMGPDYFRLGLDDDQPVAAGGGRTLILGNFSNTPVMDGFIATANFQNYPFPMPGERAPFMTGADMRNTFGFMFPKEGNQPPIAVHQDALYTLKMTVPHTAEKATLSFRGMGLQEIADESWGVTGVKIVPRTKAQFHPPLPADKDNYDTFADAEGAEFKMLVTPSFPHLIQAVTGKDATVASDAYWKLVGANEATVSFLGSAIQQVNVDAPKIKELVAKVYAGDPPADESDPRIQDILKLGITAEPLLRDLRIDAKESPSRLDWALMETNMLTVEDNDQRQWIVATRILEAIGTPEAKKARAALMGMASK